MASNAFTVLAILVAVVGAILIINATVFPLKILENTVGLASGAVTSTVGLVSGAGSFLGDAYCAIDGVFFNILPGCDPVFG